jgi:hypothetical protein
MLLAHFMSMVTVTVTRLHAWHPAATTSQGSQCSPSNRKPSSRDTTSSWSVSNTDPSLRLILAETRSPGYTRPTPLGVPVKMVSPGLSVKAPDAYAISCAMEYISPDVEPL